MKKNSLFLGVIALIGLFASCSQTETDELAGKTIEKGKQVSVTLTAPDDFIQSRTRAAVPENLKMRYIVEVWNSDATTLLQRKESVEGDTDANKFTFNLENGQYQLLCWADKIDATASTTPTTIDGVTFDHYKDLFFNTAANRTTTLPPGLKYVSFKLNSVDHFPYNIAEMDNVFCGKQEVLKTENIIDNLDITLKRPLCKIIFKQKNPSADNTTKICKAIIATEFDDGGGQPKERYVCGYQYYDVYAQNISVKGRLLDIMKDIALPSEVATNGELFFYYSFAGPALSAIEYDQKTSILYDALLEFEKADGAEKELQQFTIPKGTIQMQANRRVILTGNILKVENKGQAANFTITTDDKWSDDGEYKQDLNNSNS